MRLDVSRYCMENSSESILKLNYSKVARQFNCDRRTVSNYVKKIKETKNNTLPKRASRKSILDDYKQIIINKYTQNNSIYSIYLFIQTKGYKGSYSLVRRFCSTIKKEEQTKATMRFETLPGHQAQADWKESISLHNKKGEKIQINIFILLLGYSRYKFLKLTTDRTRDTIFKALIEGFEYFKGTPQEILFDNMRSIVNQSRTQFNQAVFNEEFYQFAKDAGFKPKACMAYRPQTKGKVEAVAHIINRIKVYDGEFDTLDELEQIVKKFNDDINHEFHQGIRKIPYELFKEKEQSYLQAVNISNLKSYISKNTKTRIVTKEAMVNYNNCKYSVPSEYISKQVVCNVQNDILIISTTEGIEITRHKLSKHSQILNYHQEDYAQAVRASLGEDASIEDICKANLDIFDKL